MRKVKHIIIDKYDNEYWGEHFVNTKYGLELYDYFEMDHEEEPKCKKCFS